jgi:hypothetical protein
VGEHARLASRRGEIDEAAKYLWHLKPPWRDEFDHVAWWSAPGEKKPGGEAAAWELFRRHPKIPDYINEFLLRPKHQPPPSFAASSNTTHLPELPTLSVCSIWPWPKLPAPCRELWRLFLENYLQPQHRVGPIGKVTALNEARLKAEIEANERRGNGHPLDLATIRAMTFRDHQTEMLDSVESHHKKGHILIAIDPRAGMGAIAKAVKHHLTALRKELGIKGAAKDRDGQRLKAVQKFEASEGSRGAKQKRDEKLFTKYRRIIKAWDCQL